MSADFLAVNLDLFKGFLLTIALFFITLFAAIPLGLPISFGSMSKIKPIRWAVRTFVWIIRGTPLMLQILVVYYGPALLFGWSLLPRLLAVSIAFVINYACYFSEIYRGGIESVAKGQYEAGKVLGLSNSQIFSKIVLFQVFKRVLAPMSNEIITLVKDTSLARVLMIAEVLKVAQDYTAYGLIWPLFFTAVYYLIFVGVLTIFFNWLEKKTSFLVIS
ncbi:MAG: amino acid ABC transporter permease [Clostridia bacterium]|nr:amino acid ABC transporter permease [Clostridia bacterium]